MPFGCAGNVKRSLCVQLKPLRVGSVGSRYIPFLQLTLRVLPTDLHLRLPLLGVRGVANMASGADRSSKQAVAEGHLADHVDVTKCSSSEKSANTQSNGKAHDPNKPLSFTVDAFTDSTVPNEKLAAMFKDLSLLSSKRFNPRLQQMLEGVYAARGGFRRNAEEIKCPRCWMVPLHCLCADFPTEARHDPGIDVLCYFHWREASVRKASNTAKLVPLLLEGGRIVACGDVATEGPMYAALDDPAGHAAVLFPSDDSITITEWRQRQEAAAATDPELATKRSSLVVLDGTWSEARLLNKFLPARATRVRLEAVPEELAQLRTRWAHPDRTNIQSMAAVIAALAEAGLPEAAQIALRSKLELAISKYVDQTFPEKAQKPLYTRADKRGNPDLLCSAVVKEQRGGAHNTGGDEPDNKV